MSSSNCCFLTCIQVSQEAGQVVWYSQCFRNFPQFIVIHTVKGFGVVNKAEIDVFMEISCFFDDPADVGNLISGSSAFSKTSGSSQFTYCWRLAWRILSITLLACEMRAIVQQFEHSLGLPFFGIGMKTDLTSNTSWHTHPGHPLKQLSQCGIRNLERQGLRGPKAGKADVTPGSHGLPLSRWTIPPPCWQEVRS